MSIVYLLSDAPKAFEQVHCKKMFSKRITRELPRSIVTIFSVIRWNDCYLPKFVSLESGIC